MKNRTERDYLGEKVLPADALYGIHTARATENFTSAGRPVHPTLIRAYGAVKLACLQLNQRLVQLLPAEHFSAARIACEEMMHGDLTQHILVDALQGGAGTSLNLNVNEVLANRTLQLLGHSPGDSSIIDPINHFNRHQSTNDTFPTALRVAALWEMQSLESEVTLLVNAFQQQERALADVVKVARTQLQDAVLTTLGRTMGAFADAFARDRWRLYQACERLRTINLGGTAIGSGVGAPRNYIFAVVDELRQVTGLPLARAENLIDATQNLDGFSEVGGFVRTLATNLLKVANDLRLMASGPHAGLAEITLPPVQTGSSIMPGKVNPVIPEATAQAAMMALGYDATLAHACAAGNLELNAFLPLVSECILQSTTLLSRTTRSLRSQAIEGLVANRNQCDRHVNNSTAAATAMVKKLGYHTVNQFIIKAQNEGISLREYIIDKGLLTREEWKQLTNAQAVLRLGSDEQSSNHD